MSLKITILYGSYREPRMGMRAVLYLRRHLEARGHAVTIVDAKEYDLPMLNRRYQDYEGHDRPEALERLKDLFEHQSDAFVVVSGEYNGTLQPGLLNIMDYFYTEFFHRPCGVVTYSIGPLGGARVSMHLLSVLNVFGMSPVPGVFAIPTIQDKLDAEGNDVSGALNQKRDLFTKSLEWYTKMFQEARHKSKPNF